MEFSARSACSADGSRGRTDRYQTRLVGIRLDGCRGRSTTGLSLDELFALASYLLTRIQSFHASRSKKEFIIVDRDRNLIPVTMQSDQNSSSLDRRTEIKLTMAKHIGSTDNDGIEISSINRVRQRLAVAMRKHAKEGKSIKRSERDIDRINIVRCSLSL